MPDLFWETSTLNPETYLNALNWFADALYGDGVDDDGDACDVPTSPPDGLVEKLNEHLMINGG